MLRRPVFRAYHRFCCGALPIHYPEISDYKKNKTIKEMEEKIAILEHASLNVPPAADTGPIGLPHDSE